MKYRLVSGPLSDGTPSRAKYRVRRIGGEDVRVRVVDADSPSFGADFHAAFKESVRRARRENKAVQSGT